MTVRLTAEQEKFIAEQVRRGHYHSADEVITQSLGMLQAQEEFIASDVPGLRAKIATGLEQIRRGDVSDGKRALEQLRE